MTRKILRVFGAALLPMALSVFSNAVSARAEDLSIATFGATPPGFAYLVAKEKGYFKEMGADVTGFLSAGGGGTIRNLIGGQLAYAEASLTAVVLAIQGGADIRIVSGTTLSPGSVYFAARKGSGVTSLSDLRGKKIGYTVPGSGTHVMAILLMKAAGLKEGEATLVKTGGLGEGLVALDQRLIDVAPFYEPAWTINRDKYQLVVAASDFLPAFTGEVGVTTGAAAKQRPEFIKAVIRARAKAIDFMRDNPKEASEIIARDYKMDAAQIYECLKLLFESEAKSGYPYFSRGELNYPAMDNVMELQRQVGAFSGNVDWSKIVDESFLTDEMREKSKVKADKK